MDSINQTLMVLTVDRVDASIIQKAIKIPNLKSLNKKVDAQDRVLNQVLNMLQGVQMRDPVFEDNIIEPQSPSVMLDAPVAGSSRQSEFMLNACTSWLIRSSGARLSVSMDGSPLNIFTSETFFNEYGMIMIIC